MVDGDWQLHPSSDALLQAPMEPQPPSFHSHDSYHMGYCYAGATWPSHQSSEPSGAIIVAIARKPAGSRIGNHPMCRNCSRQRGDLNCYSNFVAT